MESQYSVLLIKLKVFSMISIENHKKRNQKSCIYLAFRFFIKSRGRGARTPIYGFGDRRSTIELFPYLSIFYHD